MVGWAVTALAVFVLSQLILAKTSRKESEIEDEEQILGILGPIAGELLAGRMTRSKADAEVRKSEFLAPGVTSSWANMSASERDELGKNMLKLYQDPDFVSRVQNRLAPLSEAMNERE